MGKHPDEFGTDVVFTELVEGQFAPFDQATA